MIVHAIQRCGPLRNYICKLGENRATFLTSFFEDYISEKSNIIDVGAGVCNITNQLTAKGHKVTPLDVKNLSMVQGLDPELYDGHTIPFKDKSFDIGLLVTVLHHAPDSERLFDETVRVAKRTVVIEDICDSWLQKRITFFFR